MTNIRSTIPTVPSFPCHLSRTERYRGSSLPTSVLHLDVPPTVPSKHDGTRVLTEPPLTNRTMRPKQLHSALPTRRETQTQITIAPKLHKPRIPQVVEITPSPELRYLTSFPSARTKLDICSLSGKSPDTCINDTCVDAGRVPSRTHMVVKERR